MPPKKSPMRSDELFRSQLDNMIDMDHPLIKLAGLIDWSRFDEAYGRFYHEKGRPGLSTRLMAGLQRPQAWRKSQGHDRPHPRHHVTHDQTRIAATKRH